MKKLLTLALCALSVSVSAKTPSIEDQMSYPPRPPLLDFPNWWSVIAYNPQNGAFSQAQNLPSKFSILANASLKRFSEDWYFSSLFSL